MKSPVSHGDSTVFLTHFLKLMYYHFLLSFFFSCTAEKKNMAKSFPQQGYLLPVLWIVHPLLFPPPSPLR